MHLQLERVVTCLSALPWNVCMAFRHPPWLAPGCEAGREHQGEGRQGWQSSSARKLRRCLLMSRVHCDRVAPSLPGAATAGTWIPACPRQAAQGAWEPAAPNCPSEEAGRAALLSFTRLGPPRHDRRWGALSQQSRGPRPPSPCFLLSMSLLPPQWLLAGRELSFFRGIGEGPGSSPMGWGFGFPCLLQTSPAGSLVTHAVHRPAARRPGSKVCFFLSGPWR